MNENLISYELQKIQKALTKTKREHTLSFRLVKPTEKLYFSETILNTTKLGLIILSVLISLFFVIKTNFFLHASVDVDGGVSSPSKNYIIEITATINPFNCYNRRI